MTSATAPFSPSIYTHTHTHKYRGEGKVGESTVVFIHRENFFLAKKKTNNNFEEDGAGMRHANSKDKCRVRNPKEKLLFLD